jgi:hypothetical protein
MVVIYRAVASSRPWLAATWIDKDLFHTAKPSRGAVTGAVAIDDASLVRAFDHGSEH